MADMAALPWKRRVRTGLPKPPPPAHNPPTDFDLRQQREVVDELTTRLAVEVDRLMRGIDRFEHDVLGEGG